MGITSIILANNTKDNEQLNESKLMHKILGKPLVSYTISYLENIKNNKLFSIIDKEETESNIILKEYLKDYTKVTYSIKEALEDIEQGDVILTSCDSPQINLKLINELLLSHKNSQKDATVLSAISNNKELFANTVIVKLSYLKELILENQIRSITIDSVINKILTNTYNTNIYRTLDINNVKKVSSRKDLIGMISIMKNCINSGHIENGVMIIDPNNTYIEPDVLIGQDTIIEPGCMLKGSTKIGNSCFIGHNSKIENTVVEDNVSIENSIILDSYVKSNALIGPFAYIRPDSVIGSNVKIGDFVEIKNSNIGDYTKVSHLTYVGDADVGKHVNFGCGSVLVNYDGINKHRTNISDYAFIGCNTNLVSPVNIGERAFTAAGSTITTDVPRESLGISRVKQVNKEGWVAHKYPKKK